MKILKLESTSEVFQLFNWFVSGNLLVSFQFTFDVLTTSMSLIVLLISFLVHFYSYFYMAKEENLSRFLAYLSLFTFSMLLLVTANNLLHMFVGWELISFCSYLLIVFWYKKDSTNTAAAKAFLLNRFADIGFLLGIFATFTTFGSLNFDYIYANMQNVADTSFQIGGLQIFYFDFIAFMFIFAAFAKSAQLGLHT
jgi:NADH-quinone oxidoreductase subunit L